MGDVDFTLWAAELNHEEGRRKSAYKDSLGYWTIGVGCLIDARRGGGLRDNEIDFILQNRMQECVGTIQNEPWFLACDTEPRRRALVDMYFQLGPKLRGFTRSLQYITQQDWKNAAKCLRATLWAKQTPVRAAAVIGMIENG